MIPFQLVWKGENDFSGLTKVPPDRSSCASRFNLGADGNDDKKNEHKGLEEKRRRKGKKRKREIMYI